ncbi:MAG: ABC transporter permease [Deltaproteobacteria bacterium]|nr:ABC transporter permease [Deltaproteobacteria bacterium]
MKQSVLISVDFVRKLFRSRQMLWAMALRDLKAKYVGSVFGLTWAVVHPLVQVLVYGLVFGVIFKSRPDASYGTDSYILFLLTGILPWQFFQQGVTSAMGSINANSNLVKKAVGFPSELLPIISIMSSFINHLIGMGLLFVALVAIEWRLPLYAPFIIPYLFFISLFAVGLGWILSSVSVYLRDLKQVIDMLMLAWFFLTPIFYPPSIVPPGMMAFLKLNPLFLVVEGFRESLLSGRLPDPQAIAYLAFVSIMTFGIGGLFFRRLKPGFAEVL